MCRSKFCGRDTPFCLPHPVSVSARDSCFRCHGSSTAEPPPSPTRCPGCGLRGEGARGRIGATTETLVTQVGPKCSVAHPGPRPPLPRRPPHHFSGRERVLPPPRYSPSVPFQAVPQANHDAGARAGSGKQVFLILLTSKGGSLPCFSFFSHEKKCHIRSHGNQKELNTASRGLKYLQEKSNCLQYNPFFH